MANQYGIDMAAVMQTRNRNALTDLQLQTGQRKLQAYDNALTKSMKGDETLKGYGAADVAGRQDKVNRLYDIDPERAAKFEEQVRGMKADEAAALEKKTDYVGKVAAGLLMVPDEQFDETYKQTLMFANQTMPGIADDAPPMNAPLSLKKAWVQQQVNEASEVADILKRNKPGKPLKAADGYYRDPETGKRIFPDVQQPAKPRQTRELKTGGEIVTQEFNPTTGLWETMAEAPRFKKTEVSKDNTRKNAMIDDARRIVEEKLATMTPEELIKQTQSSTGTGLPNRSYDPYIAEQIKLALERKYGDEDAEFTRFRQLFFGKQEQPTIQAPAAAIDYLKANPDLAGEFDAKYGQGAAQAILQGK